MSFMSTSFSSSYGFWPSVLNGLWIWMTELLSSLISLISSITCSYNYSSSFVRNLLLVFFKVALIPEALIFMLPRRLEISDSSNRGSDVMKGIGSTILVSSMMRGIKTSYERLCSLILMLISFRSSHVFRPPLSDAPESASKKFISSSSLICSLCDDVDEPNSPSNVSVTILASMSSIKSSSKLFGLSFYCYCKFILCSLKAWISRFKSSRAALFSGSSMVSFLNFNGVPTRFF